MNFSSLVFFILFHYVVTYATIDCPVTFCSNDRIPIRFPFILQGKLHQSCGYPGFNLNCNKQGITVLTLPHGDFLVRNINYMAQQIHLNDPGNCIAGRFLNFDLSGTPFVVSLYQNYTFLQCPTQLTKSRFKSVDCLSNSTMSVLATSSISLVRAMSASCGVINTLPIPISFSPEDKEGFFMDFNDDLKLIWNAPNCFNCESRVGRCGYKSNITQEVGCFYTSQNGERNSGLQRFRLIGVSIAVPVLIFAAGVVVFAFLLVSGRNRSGTASAAAAATVTPQLEILFTGLDESTIESYEKVVLGESRRLPGLNHTSCPICLAEYCAKDTLRCIPDCKHCFHADCIDEWLRLNGTCPVCRNSPSPARVDV